MDNKRIKMSTVKQILRLHQEGKGMKTIARIVGVSKNTVKAYVHTTSRYGLSLPSLLEMEDMALSELLNAPPQDACNGRLEYFKSQLAYWEKELHRPGVTRYLLWQEYRIGQPSGYSYTQFCYHLQQHLKAASSSMVMHHQAGDKLFIDFSGKKLLYYDPLAGEEKQAEVLIGVLGYSQKACVVALESQNSEDFILGMNKILRYLGGVPAAIVPDNLKAAVVKSDRYEPIVNRIFEDFANHYQTAVVPARVLHPKDKALVENMVKITYSRIFAPLRDQVFRSIYELNEAISEHLEKHNAALFQGKDHSRNDLYENEKGLLKPLPPEPFITRKYRSYTVQKNAHICLSEDAHYYSVPYAYLGQKVEVIYTHNRVSIYHKFKLLATHLRTRKKHAYTTVEEHLPSRYRDYKDRSPDYYRTRAQAYGVEFTELINRILMRKMHVEQNYKSCDGVLRLAAKTPADVFRNACLIALQAGSCHYRFIEQLIANGMAKNYTPPVEPPLSPRHENLRGKSFFN
jgi:transposase